MVLAGRQIVEGKLAGANKSVVDVDPFSIHLIAKCECIPTVRRHTIFEFIGTFPIKTKITSVSDIESRVRIQASEFLSAKRKAQATAAFSCAQLAGHMIEAYGRQLSSTALHSWQSRYRNYLLYHSVRICRLGTKLEQMATVANHMTNCVIITASAHLVILVYF